MSKSRLYAGKEYEMVVRMFSDTVTRVCALRCGNLEDAKDCYQNVFMKLYLTDITFESQEHLKSWLIRVSITTSMDYVKQFWKRNVILNEDSSTNQMIRALSANNQNGTFDEKERDTELIEVVFKLPLKYRQVIYFHYYEEYKVSEIADMLQQPEGTVKSLLARGRKILEKELRKSEIGGITYGEIRRI